MKRKAAVLVVLVLVAMAFSTALSAQEVYGISREACITKNYKTNFGWTFHKRHKDFQIRIYRDHVSIDGSSYDITYKLVGEKDTAYWTYVYDKKGLTSETKCFLIKYRNRIVYYPWTIHPHIYDDFHATYVYRFDKETKRRLNMNAQVRFSDRSSSSYDEL